MSAPRAIPESFRNFPEAATHTNSRARAASDVIVIGAGIVGCACAEAISRRGLCVVVIEAQGVASVTTAAAMGHLVAMDDSDAQFALTRLGVRLWQERVPELPPAAEYEACGTLWVATDEEELAECRRKQAYYSERGVLAELLDGPQVAAVEPNLRPGMAGGLRVPGDGVLYPPAAAQYLLDCALRRGAMLLRGRVVSIGKGTVRLADQTTLAARFVVNAVGLAAPELTPSIVVKPRKGHLVITDRYPGFARHQIIELGYLKSAHSMATDSVAFNIQPRKTGQMLIGSSRQYGAVGREVEQSILRRMIERARLYMPDIAHLKAIRVWTGFRPSTPDKLPLIGPMADDPTVLLATGHEGLGITTATATAELIAAMVTGSPPPIPIEPYLPTRGVRHE